MINQKDRFSNMRKKNSSSIGESPIVPYYLKDCSSLFYLSRRIEEFESILPYCEKAEDMSQMFRACHIQNLNLTGLKTSSVKSMRGMFDNAFKEKDDAYETTLDLYFDTSKVENFADMFFSTAFRNINVSSFNTSAAKNMSGMFRRCAFLTDLDLSHFIVNNVQNMRSMFDDCWELTNLNLSGWDINQVTDMSNMFMRCHKLSSLKGLENWNTSSVTDMDYMFYDCQNLKNIDIKDWDTSSVTDMDHMFDGCESITEYDLSKWDIKNVTSMHGMFRANLNLEYLNLSNWDIVKTQDFGYMFYDCSKLKHLILGDWEHMLVKYGSLRFDNTFTGIPADCLIEVPTEKMKEQILALRGDFTNIVVKT